MTTRKRREFAARYLIQLLTRDEGRYRRSFNGYGFHYMVMGRNFRRRVGGWFEIVLERKL
jgi:hypothetical protein